MNRSLAIQKMMDQVEGIGRTQTLAELEDNLASFFAEHGYTAFIMASLSSGDDPDCRFYLLHCPEHLLNWYFEQGVSEFDPLAGRMIRGTAPFAWDRADWTSATQYGGFEKSASVFDVPASHGIKAGFVVPVYKPGAGPTGATSLLGDREAPKADERVMLTTVALYGYEQALELAADGKGSAIPIPKRNALLTRREAEALKWVAMGKTDAEIGNILGIATATAHFHVENAKRKLEASTRAQATALAVHFGHISL